MLSDKSKGIETEGRTTMDTSVATLSTRDRAVLRAVAAGRCQISHGDGSVLVIDGLCYCDQFAGPRLTAAGFIASAGSGTAHLTPSGQALLSAA
jgi:hypothetical protein